MKDSSTNLAWLLWFQHKLLVGRLVDLPDDRLVKQAFTHAQQQKTTWFQNVSSWLSDYGFQGVIANGTFSVSNAMTTLRDKWFSQVCQSDLTKVNVSWTTCFMIQSKWLNTVSQTFCKSIVTV